MPDTSIVDAKAQLPNLIRQAESGEPVHLTRRGKRVAVILSESEFGRLSAAAGTRLGYLDFLADWRERLTQEGCESLTEQEIANLRSNDLGRDFSFDA